jgi:dihydroorotase
VARLLALVEQTGVRAHFCRLTSARALGMVARARATTACRSAPTWPPYLFLTELDIAEFDSRCHVLPPLRTQEDRDALRALANAVLVALCSDHQPHEPTPSARPSPPPRRASPASTPCCPWPCALVEQNVLPLPVLIERLTAGPARVLGLAAGRLGVGDPADVCVFDPEAHWTVRPQALASRGRNTPFSGRELPGRVSHTLLAGRPVYQTP